MEPPSGYSFVPMIAETSEAVTAARPVDGSTVPACAIIGPPC
jgi:hypothetical protein